MRINIHTAPFDLAEASHLPNSPHVTSHADATGALEIVLDGNRISHETREMLERPENELRPVRIREYRRPAEVEDGAWPQVVEDALGRNRRAERLARKAS